MPEYTPHVWADGAGGGTPLNAATLNEMETGIERASIPTKVTALPGSPYDGQEVYFEADEANGVYWHLRYRSASTSAHKWEFLGGGPLSHEVLTSETTSSTSYVDLATVGPQVTLPAAGDYEISFGAQLRNSTGDQFAAVKLGAAATSDDDRIGHNTEGDPGSSGARTMRRNGLAASDVIKIQYKVDAGSMAAERRWLFIRPIRVG